MKKFGIAFLLLIIILVVIAVFYFDLFNLLYSKEAAIASIISSEDTRRVSGKFIEYLSDPDPEIRARAALAVGRIGDIGAGEQLFELLADSSAEVAQTAAFAIGLMGEKSYAPRLLDLCAEFPPDLLAAAVQSVGRLSDSTMTDVHNRLAEYLEHLDHRVREQAAYAMFRAGAKSQADRLIDICRNDAVRPVQVAALYSLVRMDIKEPTDLYVEWLPDAFPSVRSLALRGMGLPKDDGNVSLIASGLNDRDNNVVSQAISSLTSVGSPKAIKFLAAAYGNATDEKLKVQFLESFTELKSNALLDYVFDDISDDSCTINIMAAAIVYLAEINKEATIPLIDSLAETDDNYLKTKIARALGQIGGETVKPRLAALFNDSVAAVRAAAFEVLCDVDEENVGYYFKTALADADYVINSLAADRIGRLKRCDFLPQLMTIMQMRERAGTDLRRSVVQTAGELLGGGCDSLAEDILYRGLLENDYLVSRDAAKIYSDKLGIDKSAYINKPFGLVSARKIKSLLNEYVTNPEAVIHTKRGEIKLELFFDIAPLTVYNFISLARKGFYDNVIFHRVVPNFVIQGGDPRGDGWGGPGYTIRCEYSSLTYERGMVGIAHSGEDSGGSQFFITLSPQHHLDARYTIFGRVVSGMDVADAIVRGDTIEHISIIEE